MCKRTNITAVTGIIRQTFLFMPPPQSYLFAGICGKKMTFLFWNVVLCFWIFPITCAYLQPSSLSFRFGAQSTESRRGERHLTFQYVISSHETNVCVWHLFVCIWRWHKNEKKSQSTSVQFPLTGEPEVIDCRHCMLDALIHQTWSPYNSPDTLARTHHTHKHSA